MKRILKKAGEKSISPLLCWGRPGAYGEGKKIKTERFYVHEAREKGRGRQRRQPEGMNREGKKATGSVVRYGVKKKKKCKIEKDTEGRENIEGNARKRRSWTEGKISRSTA